MQADLFAHIRIHAYLQSEFENLYPGLGRSAKMTDIAHKAAALAKDSRTTLKKLEGVAQRTEMVSDIFDHIKRQIGKKGSMEAWNKGGFGEALLTFFENDLNAKAKELSSMQVLTFPGISRDEVHLRIWLELVRSAIAHLVAHSQFSGAREQQHA